MSCDASLVEPTSVAVHIAAHVASSEHDTSGRHSNAELSLAEARGKDCNAWLVPECEAPLLRNVCLMGYVYMGRWTGWAFLSRRNIIRRAPKLLVPTKLSTQSFPTQLGPTFVEMEIPLRERSFA